MKSLKAAQFVLENRKQSMVSNFQSSNLFPCYSKCGPWTSSINTTWELIRNVQPNRICILTRSTGLCTIQVWKAYTTPSKPWVSNPGTVFPKLFQMWSRSSTQETQYFLLKSRQLSIPYCQWESPGNIVSVLKALKYSVVEKTLTMTFLNMFEHKTPLKFVLSLNVPVTQALAEHQVKNVKLPRSSFTLGTLSTLVSRWSVRAGCSPHCKIWVRF